MLDPRDHVLRPGVYRVLQVNDDASIDVSVPSSMNVNAAMNGIASTTGTGRNSAQRMRIRLLGIALSHPLEAAGQLRERIDAGQQQIRLRFDRRRLDDTGTLLAYVFVDDVLLNEELVRLEFADPDTHPTDSGPMIRRISAWK